jgi:hypothetical protein
MTAIDPREEFARQLQADAMDLAIRTRDRNRARRPAPVWRLDEVAVFLAAGFAVVMIVIVGLS